MVGHSQLDSHMLQASPQAHADQDNVADNVAAVNGDVVECEEEGAVDAEDSNEEGMDGFAAGPTADEALAMPEPGCKRKRSKLQHSRMQPALLVSLGLMPCQQTIVLCDVALPYACTIAERQSAAASWHSGDTMQQNPLRIQRLEMLKLNLQVLGNVPSMWMDLLHMVVCSRIK